MLSLWSACHFECNSADTQTYFTVCVDNFEKDNYLSRPSLYDSLINTDQASRDLIG